MGTRYVALLRGINVGGRNTVLMADLRAAFDEHGLANARTYIQSGNVLFDSDSDSAGPGLETEIETMLETRLGIALTVVVRSRRQLARVVADAPEIFGAQPRTHHCDALFLKQPLTSAQALRVVQLRDGVDQCWPGPGVLYFARRSDQRTRSKMSTIVGTPEYRQMTIRNWTTTLKLLALLQDS